jgi:hypothetical protein
MMTIRTTRPRKGFSLLGCAFAALLGLVPAAGAARAETPLGPRLRALARGEEGGKKKQ